MHFTILFLLAVTLPALSVSAQGHRGGGGAGGGFGGGRGGGNGGGNAPSTFITVTSAAPPAATTTSSSSAGAGAASGGGSGSDTATVDGSSCPAFGITAGVKASDGTANCAGDNGVDIPCNCPPDLNTFTSFLGEVVSGGAQFPSGTSAADQLTRLQTCLVALQNFRGGQGSGVGCPIVSTMWKELQAQLQSEV
ncbi:hypothetical protein LTR46_004853 [Exophiala xenobiotica]|nr:hypothetical protein LTR46_004853 [Exophiala xenobiotica]